MGISKTFIALASFCLYIFIFAGSQNEYQTTSSYEISKPAPKPKSQQATNKYFSQFEKAYKKVISQKDNSKKLSAIVDALSIAKKYNIQAKKTLQYLHILSANIHRSRWHVVYAINSYKKAQSLIYDKFVEQQMLNLQQYLSKADSERFLYDDYIATKYSGPAKTFKGKILVAYVFVDDGIKTRWSKKNKLRTQQVLALVQQWQKEKAKQYQIKEIDFINKTFVVSRNPYLKKPKSVSFGSSSQDVNRYVNYIAQSLSEKSIGSFIKKQVEKSGADQGVVILHTNLDKRSFAHRCSYTHSKKIFRNNRYETKMISTCQDEYVMLMENVKRNQWQKMHYAQAHEMMHVFGAADLYNIKKANNYAVTDIMNYQSKNLINSQVEPITAYAIGWLKKPPDAPFKVLEK